MRIEATCCSWSDRGVQLVPAFLIDRLPLRLWKPGNDYLGMRLHMCVAGAESDPEITVRTVEWKGNEIGRGRRPLDFEAVPWK